MKQLLLTFTATAMLGLAPAALAQTWGPTGTSTVSVSINPEASLRIDTQNTALSSATTFSDFTGTTNLTYRIRTTKTGGTGAITMQVTSDFSPANGPSVASPISAGDALAYTCAVDAPGTGCTGSLNASTTAATSVATFGANARSTKAGSAGSVAWTLTNDPAYETGTYQATVTFTISAT